MNMLDKYQGCLIGGAIGDALGYAVEFDLYNKITEKYGSNGITEYELTDGLAYISDDTQMTLFTAVGLIFGKEYGVWNNNYTPFIESAYQDWYKTQTQSFDEVKQSEGFRVSWILDVPDLFKRRAPGNACLSSSSENNLGSIEKPINDSKGCGGVMRVAPIGLYFDANQIEQSKIDRLGAEAAALTHGNPMGYIPAAFMVHIISLISHNDVALSDAVKSAIDSISAMFADTQDIEKFIVLIEKAIDLSQNNAQDEENIRSIGEGWIGDEALAIAIYCVLKYQNDFEKCIIAAVNHNGDSDSTGSIAGNILGAYLGLEAIPQKFIPNLELKDLILEIANDLYCDSQEPQKITAQANRWTKKYIACTV